MSSKQFLHSRKKDCTESLRRVEYNLFQNFVVEQKRYAAECSCRVQSEGTHVQGPTLKILSRTYTLPLAFMPYNRTFMTAGIVLNTFLSNVHVPSAPVPRTR